MGILAGRTTSTATTTESLWAERVRAWRASGEPVAHFVRGRGDSASALRSWAQRLGPTEPSPRFVRVVPSKPGPAAGGSSELVLEVGAVRVRIAPGFDPALLADVLRALGGAR
ncbi:MAG TPA: hypothetical protein VFS21_06620 [Roseiflexaceae bacterium]|nr:hypothetical protein [Roseiflexaceae bacterium]